MGVNAISGFSPIDKIEAVSEIGKLQQDSEKQIKAIKKDSKSFSELLNNIRQADKASEITAASSSASTPAKVQNFSTTISGDYISSMKLENPTPADTNAPLKGDAAKSIMANGTTVDKTSKLYEKSLELESYFVKIMINTMRKTLSGSGLADNSYASKMYKDMQYDELSRSMTKNAGFGLADQIYLQLKNS